MVTINGRPADLKCLSTDEKPTNDVAPNTLLLEVDTGKFYYFDGEEWKVVGWRGGDNNNE